MNKANRFVKWWGTSVVCVFSGLSVLSASAAELNLENWIRTQTTRSLNGVHAAISPRDGAPGSIMASPSRANPDYYAYWVRDGSLVMKEVFAYRSLDRRAVDTLKDFAMFSRRNQLTPNKSGEFFDRALGEPKFEIDGSPYTKNWGRPQNDGPALRASVLITLAEELILQGDRDFVSRVLYRAELPATTVIKADLEYTAHHWRESNFDLWEEVNGHHFYTRIAQWRALEDGSSFAKRMGDGTAANYYHQQAGMILESLQAYWSSNAGYLLTTLGTNNNRGKDSNLDIAVLLGVNQSSKPGFAFSVTDPRVIATAYALERKFAEVYTINGVTTDRDGRAMAPGLGRYAEDVYNGNGEGRGNPWFLATHAMAEYLLTLRGELKRAGSVQITDLTRPFFQGLVSRQLMNKRRLGRTDPTFNEVLTGLQAKSDAYIRRSRFHTGANGSQAEQFNREDGFMQGARDLTWSYASFLSLRRVRDRNYE